MPLSAQARHRLTAILSTLVAVAIVAGGGIAQNQDKTPPESLERLESDLRFQIESGFRLEPRVAKQRLRQVDDVIAAFRANANTPTDSELLADWLLAATLRSMPGSIDDLPAPPEFGVAIPPATPIAAPVEIASPQIEEVPVAPVPDEQDETPTVEASAVEEPAPQPSVVSFDSKPAEVEDFVAPEKAPPVAADAPKQVATIEPAILVSDRPANVDINISELAARVIGYHQGLDQLEAALLGTNRSSDDRIHQHIEHLASLVPDYQFAKLYYESLKAKERLRVPTPRGLAPVIADIYKQIEAVQYEIDTDFLGEFDTDAAERLEELRSHLKQIEQSVRWL